ncbi:MAG: hypothetical protein RIA63_07640, partial [Cyclobacteriaceae bacterium]
RATYTDDLYLIPPPTTVVLGVKWSDLKTTETELLSKILNSVKLSLDAVRVVIDPELDLSQWEEKPAKLIAFGIKISGVTPYEVVNTPETSLILADSLSILSESDELKKKLWGSLKQLFFT